MLLSFSIDFSAVSLHTASQRYSIRTRDCGSFCRYRRWDADVLRVGAYHQLDPNACICLRFMCMGFYGKKWMKFYVIEIQMNKLVGCIRWLYVYVM